MNRLHGQHHYNITASLFITATVSFPVPFPNDAVQSIAPNHSLTTAKSSSKRLHGMFVYSQCSKDGSGKSQDEDGSDIFSYSIPDGTSRCILDHTKSPIRGIVTSVAIAPSGKTIALIAKQTHHTVNGTSFTFTGWLLAPHYSSPEKIKLDGDVQSLQWSPDGSYLAICVGTVNANRLWIVRNSDATSIATNIENSASWTWTSDSHALLYVNGKSQLVLQSPFAPKASTTWRLGSSDITPISSTIYPILGADEHHVYQFSDKGRRLLFNTAREISIIPDQVVADPASHRIAVQTSQPETPDASQSEQIPMSTNRAIYIISPGSKRQAIPMHWCAAPAFGPTTYHVMCWDRSGKRLFILHEIDHGRTSADPLPYVEIYLLNAFDKFKATPGEEPILGRPIFRSTGKVSSIDWVNTK